VPIAELERVDNLSRNRIKLDIHDETALLCNANRRIETEDRLLNVLNESPIFRNELLSSELRCHIPSRLGLRTQVFGTRGMEACTDISSELKRLSTSTTTTLMPHLNLVMDSIGVDQHVVEELPSDCLIACGTKTRLPTVLVVVVAAVDLPKILRETLRIECGDEVKDGTSIVLRTFNEICHAFTLAYDHDVRLPTENELADVFGV
jgi:hypothetical protein